jgi:hypothetical protein
MCQFLTHNQIQKPKFAQYLSDLVLCNFFIFSKTEKFSQKINFCAARKDSCKKAELLLQTLSQNDFRVALTPGRLI